MFYFATPVQDFFLFFIKLSFSGSVVTKVVCSWYTDNLVIIGRTESHFMIKNVMKK